MGIPIRHFGLVLVVVIGVCLCYNACFQYTATNVVIELNGEGETSLKSCGQPFDLYDEDQFPVMGEFAPMAVFAMEVDFSTVGCKETRQSFDIWQPPKIN